MVCWTGAAAASPAFRRVALRLVVVLPSRPGLARGRSPPAEDCAALPRADRSWPAMLVDNRPWRIDHEADFRSTGSAVFLPAPIDRRSALRPWRSRWAAHWGALRRGLAPIDHRASPRYRSGSALASPGSARHRRRAARPPAPFGTVKRIIIHCYPQSQRLHTATSRSACPADWRRSSAEPERGYCPRAGRATAPAPSSRASAAACRYRCPSRRRVR